MEKLNLSENGATEIKKKVKNQESPSSSQGS